MKRKWSVICLCFWASYQKHKLKVPFRGVLHLYCAWSSLRVKNTYSQRMTLTSKIVCIFIFIPPGSKQIDHFISNRSIAIDFGFFLLKCEIVILKPIVRFWYFIREVFIAKNCCKSFCYINKSWRVNNQRYYNSICFVKAISILSKCKVNLKR